MKKVKGLFSAIMVMALAVSLSIPAFAASTTVQIRANDDANGKVMIEISNVNSVDNSYLVPIYFSDEPVIKFSSALNYKRIKYLGPGSTVADFEARAMGPAPEPTEIEVSAETKLTQPGMYLVAGDIVKGDVYETFARAEIIVTGGKAQTTTEVTANKTASTFMVDGKQVAFDAYNIDGSNYFKLRDLAKVVSGTQKQFDVSWDDSNKAINLVSGTAYTVVGGELATGGGATMKATANTAAILKDKVAVKLAAYNINGNNYFKLRDAGQAFNFAVTWDAATNSINIDTSKAYTP